MTYVLKPGDAFDVDVESTEYLGDHVDTGDRWTLNFGPQHPATHTTLRLVLELDGERIARCTPHIGYLHSGFEKIGEHLDYNQYVTIVSRMNYLSPISNDICWHHAVETLFGIGERRSRDPPIQRCELHCEGDSGSADNVPRRCGVA